MTAVPLRMRPIAMQKLLVQASLVRRLDNMPKRGGTVQVWACIGLLKFALILRRHRVIISHRKGPEIALVWVAVLVLSALSMVMYVAVSWLERHLQKGIVR